MRGAALSDLHLGFRAFPATIDGRNAREVDVEHAWAAAVQQVIDAQPDLVTIAGDVVHHPRVGTHAVKAWRDGVRRIVEETTAHVIVIQGNHDAGRTAEVLTPIVLPDDLPRVHIVTEPRRIHVETPTGVAAVACFPFVSRGNGEAYKLEPDPEADVNVLLMHAAVKGSADGDTLPYFYGGGDEALDIGREADRWDVVAVGDYHEFTRLHPSRLAFYSGSIERTSSNIWVEHAPKGWVLYDTDTGEMEFREVPTRGMHDDALEGDPAGPVTTAAAVNDRLAKISANEGHQDSIVRLRVDQFPRDERADVDWALVRELKRSCLHFYLDLRFRARATEELGDRRDRKVSSLAEEFAAFFALDEEAVRRIAERYLELEAEAEDLAESSPERELEESVA